MFIGLTVLFVSAANRVSAANDNAPLYAAATDYRLAVLKFERVVRAVRGIERIDERLVDDFEEATKTLRLASRNPRHSNRLRKEWREIQPLQMRVEATIFGKYTYNHDLVRCWEIVLYMQDRFYEEYLFTLDNPRHGSSVQRRVSRSRPERFVPPPPASSGMIYGGLRSGGR